jgi:hypothetical protein
MWELPDLNLSWYAVIMGSFLYDFSQSIHVIALK